LFVLVKKDSSKDFWPRLVKSTVKNQYLQIDWSKWVDEDEEENEGDKGLSGYDPSQMQSNNNANNRFRYGKYGRNGRSRRDVRRRIIRRQFGRSLKIIRIVRNKKRMRYLYRNM
jgi:hypothetical protein